MSASAPELSRGQLNRALPERRGLLACAAGRHRQAPGEIDHPDRAEIELGTVLQALSDPVRLKIVAALAAADGEPTCGSFDVPVTKSTCTHHFKVLREAGVIRQRQMGTARRNTLRRDDLDARFPGLLETVLDAADG